MKIAVTGTTGQLGSAVVRELERCKFETISVDRSCLDFFKMGSIQASLSGLDPEIIVNCAAYTQVDNSESNSVEAFAINAMGPTELARYCREKQIRLIHISTDSVFSSSSPVFFKPLDTPSPLNTYARSKLQGEIGVQKEHPSGATIIRTAWLFGHGANKFVQAMIERGKRGEPFQVVDDQFGQPTLITSLAEFITFLVTANSRNGIYHFASTNYLSRYEFAKNILEMSRLDPSLVTPCATVVLEGVAERPKYSLLDVSESSVNWYTRTTFWQQELERFFDSMIGNQ
jgi:dTDP-4-dehydrorhamnose reductase